VAQVVAHGDEADPLSLGMRRYPKGEGEGFPGAFGVCRQGQFGRARGPFGPGFLEEPVQARAHGGWGERRQAPAHERTGCGERRREGAAVGEDFPLFPYREHGPVGQQGISRDRPGGRNRPAGRSWGSGRPVLRNACGVRQEEPSLTAVRQGQTRV
jgi:hypothetical protein